MNIGSLDRDANTPLPRTNTQGVWASLNTRKQRALETAIMKAEAIGRKRIELTHNTKEGATK